MTSTLFATIARQSVTLHVTHSPSARIHFFFFYCSADHRDLHSFPTRRSSDPRPSLEARHPSRDAWAARLTEAVRSEEHTSELQSPYDLVCRLLLEKKKQAIRSLLVYN